MKKIYTHFKNFCLVTALSFFTVIETKAATYTATVSGNWSSGTTWAGGMAPGNNITLDNVIIPTGIDVTLDQHVVFNGVLTSLDVTGSLMSANMDSLEITIGTLSGSGSMTLEYLSFGTLGTMSFTGTLNVNTMDNSSLSLSLASTVQVDDTLVLRNGSLTIGSGANLTLATSSNVKIDNGSMTIGGGIFSSSNSYNVIYIGSSKTTGVELDGSGLANVYVQLDDNTQNLSLSSDVIINGILNHEMGTVNLNGNKLTLKDDYVANSGVMFSGSATSSMVINSTDSISNSIAFESASNMLDEFEINITSGGNVDVSSDLEINGKLKLTNGSLTVIGSYTLTAVAASEIERHEGSVSFTGGSSFDGSASYNVSYYGSSKTVGVEISGAGINDVMLNLTSASDSVSLNTHLNVNGTLNLASGSLDLKGYDLDIKDDFMASANGYIMGDSASDVTISSSSQLSDTLQFYSGKEELSTLVINVSDGSFVVLGSALMVENLNLISGGLTLHNNDLTLNSTGSITGYDVNKYIKTNGSGSLVRTVAVSSPYIEFPVGTNSNYSPVSIQQNAGVADKFYVNTVNGVWSMGTSGTNLATTEEVVNRTWNISKSQSAATDINLKAEWVTAAEVNGFNRAQAYISHYVTATGWDSSAAVAAMATGNGTYQITRNNITSLSPFAVLDETSTVGINENQVSVSGMFPNPVKDVLTYSINAAQPVVIELMDITGKIIYTERIPAAGMVITKTIDCSAFPSGIYMIKFNSDNNQVIKRIVKS